MTAPALNDGHRYTCRVRAVDAGRTLLDFLAGRYRHSSRDEWRSRIEAGRVQVDGLSSPCGATLRAGQAVDWLRPPWREPQAPLHYEVLHRDASILAVCKPAGLPTLPGGGFLTHTLLHRVRLDDPAAAPLHRLGRFTSGIVLFARGAAARRSLSEQFRNRRVDKRYLGLACGTPATRRFIVDVPIGPVPHPLLGTVHAAAAGGRAARSEVEVARTLGDRFIARVRIESGRPHQIRIHLSAAGHPLVGEPLFVAGGLPQSGSAALPGDGGYQLHAARLAFPHPRSGRRCELRCPAPAAGPLAGF